MNLLAALPCAGAFLFLPGAAAPWWLAVTTLCASAALARLLGTWCADPALGVLLAGSAASTGIILQSRAARPDEDEARVWAAGAGLLITLLPVLLRFLGLNTASAVFLEEPRTSGVFVLGQVWLSAAAAAAAAARAARGLARPAGKAQRCVPLLAALAASAGASRHDAAILLAAAGAALACACVLQARPWARWQARPLQTQALILSALLALGLAFRSPGLMRDVWTARLDTIYPGGRFLSLVDDGVRVRGVYEFSTKERTALRDGVLQGDETSGKVSLIALRGQKVLMRAVLVVNAPSPVAPAAAAALGLTVALSEDSLAEAPGEKPEGLVLFLPRPLAFMQARRLAGRASLRALRSRLTEDSCAMIVVPAGASPAAVARIESAAREVFGVTRTADTGRAVLVAACPDAVETDHSVIYGRMPSDLRTAEPGGDKALTENLRWRPAPTAK
ncbi:MAG: hypothetical protein AAB262_01000 [Elusimicrobiota bacterium]